MRIFVMFANVPELDAGEALGCPPWQQTQIEIYDFFLYESCMRCCQAHIMIRPFLLTNHQFLLIDFNA